MISDDDRMSRLSGECNRVAFYTRRAVSPLPASPRPVRPPSYPRRPLPRTPQPRPAPRKAPGKPVPFRPFTPPRKPFGTPNAPTNPLVPKSPFPVGGLARKALSRLARRSLLGTVALETLEYLTYRRDSRTIPWNLDKNGFRNTKTGYPEGGWTFIPGVAYSGGDTRFGGASNDPNLSPQITGQIPSGPFATSLADIVTSRWIAFGPFNQGMIGRYQIRDQWLRPNTGTVPNLVADGLAPWIHPFPLFVTPPAPFFIPDGVDPFGIPIGQPVPTPKPIPFKDIPHRRNNPFRAPSERPQPGRRPGRDGGVRTPGERPRDDPDYDPLKVRRRKPKYKHKPGKDPVDETEIHKDPKGRLRSRNRPGLHVRRKPTAGEREGKFVAGKAAGFLMDLVGLVTESADLIHVWFKSLDPETQKLFRWKDSTILDLLGFVLLNLDKTRIGHLVAGIIANALEDAGIGRLGKQAAKQNQLLHKHFGIDLQGRMPKSYLNKSPQVRDRFTEELNRYLEGLLG